MQIHLADFVKQRAEHAEIENIIRSCVHCGFCNATCPTYQLTGDELDGPRGRIYLLKQALEGQKTSQITQHHLDRCLSCRSCETTCPSGVEYGRLLDLGRVVVEENVSRSFLDSLLRFLMLRIFPYRLRFKYLIKLAAVFKSVVPQKIAAKIPRIQKQQEQEQEHCLTNFSRKVLLLPGCVQPSLAPDIDQSVIRVLAKLKISAITVLDSGCCGALNYHLSDHQQAKQFARSNIDQCWPYIEQGVEAIVISASGCGLSLKEYKVLLQDDPDYAAKAERFSQLVQDLCEIISNEDLSVFNKTNQTIAYQSPCTLQHGQQLNGVVESILERIGCTLTEVNDSHLCCGSAGVYSLLQPVMSEQLRKDKITALTAGKPQCVATANIGCLTHLQPEIEQELVHWIELLQ